MTTYRTGDLVKVYNGIQGQFMNGRIGEVLNVVKGRDYFAVSFPTCVNRKKPYIEVVHALQVRLHKRKKT